MAWWREDDDLVDFHILYEDDHVRVYKKNRSNLIYVDDVRSRVVTKISSRDPRLGGGLSLESKDSKVVESFQTHNMVGWLVVPH